MKHIYVKKKILFFYKIRFYDWNFNKVLSKLKSGGYLVAPAASSLIDINKNNYYYKSLKASTVAIFDSGFFCILLRLFLIYKPKKFSGYLFLKNFLNKKNFRNKKILLINSSDRQGELNEKIFYNRKFKKIYSYTAPIYNSSKINDPKIIDYINKYKPHFIIINISGLKQEPLAFSINKKIKFKCVIFCLGGAIDFINGLQAPINTFTDKIYIGWLMRVIYNPKIFFVRVLKSFLLIKYFLLKKTLTS